MLVIFPDPYFLPIQSKVTLVGRLLVMKYVYFGFGGFIGFICGVAINLIFYLLDQSGVKFAAYLIKTFGFFGEYILKLIDALPILGAVLGFILIKYLFGREFEEKREG
ncbi:MAG: hypothetical protein ACI9UO_001040 [Nitrospinales bacterium]